MLFRSRIDNMLIEQHEANIKAHEEVVNITESIIAEIDSVSERAYAEDQDADALTNDGTVA